MIYELLILCVVLKSSQNVPMVYPNGRAFPPDSLSYVKFKFKGVNPNITWDTQNYLEVMSANLSSCNYPQGMMDGYAKIPTNASWVAFIEYQNSSATAKRDVVASLNPVIDKWLARKRYNMQILGAAKFGCSASPGCGNRENRMGISCVFSPSSPKYIHEIIEYEDATPFQEVNEINKTPYRPVPTSRSEPMALTMDQYHNGQLVTGKRWERGHFLENLSRLETNCGMVVADSWNFTNHLPVIYGLDAQIEGFFGRNILVDDIDLTIDVILPTMKDKLPPNIQIGCTYIANCNHGDVAWMVLSCLYEERCRKQLCF